MVDRDALATVVAAGPSASWRIQVLPARPFNPLGLLANQCIWPRCYWRSRDGRHELVALGSAAVASTLEAAQHLLDALPSASAPLLVGGLAFDGEQPQWPDFPAVHLFLPQLLWQRQGERWRLVVAIAPGEPGQAQAERLLDQLVLDDALPAHDHRGCRQSVLPDRQRWGEWVGRSLASTALAKVVLARLSTVHLTAPANPWALLAQWQAAVPNSYPFAVALGPRTSFIGCSPERLFARCGRELLTEALAGTVAFGGDARAAAAELTGDDKIRLENELVAQDIVSRLIPLSHHWQIGAAEINPLVDVAHLRRPIRAELQPGVSDASLLRILHPTPAVGGSPRAAALAHIRSLEDYPRGWYAGAVGYLGHEHSEMVVAIRSALVEDRLLHLFAGVGLVQGSDADSEWQELNHKVTTLLKLLGLSR